DDVDPEPVIHVVEHEGRNQFVGSPAGFQEARNRTAQRPGRRGGRQGQRHVDDGRQLKRDAHHGGGDRAEEQLALRADVELARLEHEGKGQAGEYEGNGHLDEVAEAAHAGEGARHQGTERVPWFFAYKVNDDVPQGQRNGDGHQRPQDFESDFGLHTATASAGACRFKPSMYSPSSSSLTWSAWAKEATISPL